MKKGLIRIFSLVTLALVFMTSCKTEFEKIRTSGDVDLLYKKAYEYYEAGRYVKAQALFELVMPSYRGKKELEDIYFKYANTYYFDKQYILSSYYFKNFTNTFPNSDLREEAEYMSAYSNYKLSPNPKLDQTNTLKAIDEFQLFINTFPKSAHVPEANKLMDELRIKLEQKALNEVQLYYDLQQYQAAVLVGENLLKDFPETKNGEYVRYLLTKASYLLAENSVIDKQSERFQAVRKYGSNFLKKYKKSKFRREVNSMMKKSLSKIKKLDNERYQNKNAGR